MVFAKGFIGSLLGGVIGAIVWMLVGYFTRYELGFIAWGIGFLAGLGMALGTSGRGSWRTGLAACAVAVLCVMGGKLGVASMEVHRYTEEATTITDDEAVELMTQKIYFEQEEAGTLPDEPDDEATGWPPSIAAAAHQQWEAMDVDQREAFRSEQRAKIAQELRDHQGAATALYFLFSFGLWGFVWTGLAVASAYKLGSARLRTDDGRPIATSVDAGPLKLTALPLQTQTAETLVVPPQRLDATLPERPAAPRFSMTGEPLDPENPGQDQSRAA